MADKPDPDYSGLIAGMSDVMSGDAAPREDVPSAQKKTKRGAGGGRTTRTERLAKAKDDLAIAALKAKQARARVDKIEAEIASAGTPQANDDPEERRSALVGTIIRAHVAHIVAKEKPLSAESDQFLRTVFRLLDQNVEGADDRKAFRLPVRP